jgi:tight adherence protein B
MGALLGFLLGLGLLLIWQHNAFKPRGGRDRQSLGWATRRGELLHQAGLTGVSSWQLLGLQCGFALATGIAALTVTDSISVAACFAAFAFAAPMALVRRLRRTRMVDLREVWPEAIDNLASGVRAGLSLPEAVAALGERGPEQLRPAFSRFGTDYRASGRFIECLDRLKDTLADPVGDRVCETFRVAREVGGSELGVVLRTLSAFLREDARTRGELESRQSWTVNAARLAVASPWLILLLLATQATSLQAFDSPAGVTLLGTGAATCLVAYQLMLRIGRLPAERRVLR